MTFCKLPGYKIGHHEEGNISLTLNFSLATLYTRRHRSITCKFSGTLIFKIRHPVKLPTHFEAKINQPFDMQEHTYSIYHTF